MGLCINTTFKDMSDATSTHFRLFMCHFTLLCPRQQSVEMKKHPAGTD